EEEDEDFGSFDEASFEEIEPTNNVSDETLLYPASSEELSLTTSRILRLLDLIVPVPGTSEPADCAPLLSKEAELQFKHLSKPPRLQPPNWTKLKLRHNLLLRLGIPINLDELAPSGGSGGVKHDINRKSLISESDLDWSRFNIPDIEILNLTQEARQDLLGKTAEILTKIERENMENTSELHLQSSLSEALESKLSQMRNNHDQLLMLSSLWHGKLEDLKASQTAYESVVQSMVGYNQKIQRNELLESLRRSKTKRGKK
ncbi:hypothetical protein METBIDRAFT_14694, partial [Metschnikowia bicuspidata var. bicuspidata NRRL YB-4993]